MRSAPLAAILLLLPLCATFGPGVSAETPPQGATDSGADDPVQAANSNRAASRRSIPQHPAPFRASFDINSYGTTEFWNWVSESESRFEPFGKQVRENSGGGGVGLFETPSADLASVQSAVRSTDSTIKNMADELPRVLRHFQQQAASKNSAGAATGVATDTTGVTAQGGNIFRAELEWKDLMPHGPMMTPGGGGAEKANSVRSIPAAAPATPAATGEKRPGRKGSRNKNRPNSGAQVPSIIPTAPQAPPQPARAPPPPQTSSASPAQLFAPEPVLNPAPLLAPQPIHVASVAPTVAPQLLRLATAAPPLAPQTIRVVPAAAPPLAPLAPAAPQPIRAPAAAPSTPAVPQAWGPAAAPPTGQVFLLNPKLVPQPPPAVAPPLPVVQVEPRAPPAPAPPKRTKTRTPAQLAARKQKAVERARIAAAGAAGDQSIQQSAEPSKETTQEPQVNVYYHEQLLGSDPAINAQLGESPAQPTGDPAIQSASQPTNDPVKDPATASQKDPESAYQSNPVDAYPSDPTGAYTSDQVGAYPSEQADTYQKDPESAYQSEPAGAYQSEPAGTYPSDPTDAYRSESAGAHPSDPRGAYQSEPAGNQSDPESAYQTDSAGAYQADPETTYQSDPEGTYQTNPAGDPTTQDEAAEQPPASESIVSAPADPINADQGDMVIDPNDQKLSQVAIETAAEPYEQYQSVDDPSNDQTEIGNPPARLQDRAINGGDQDPADWNQPEAAELQTGHSEPAQAEPQVPYVLKRTKSGSRKGSRKNNKGSSDKQPTGRQGTRRPKRIKTKDAAMEQQLATSCQAESHPGSPQATAEAAAGVYEESYSQDQTVGVDSNPQESLQTTNDSSLQDQAPLLEPQGEPINSHPQEQVAIPPQDPYILPELPQEDSTQPPADSSAQFLEPPTTSDSYGSTDYPAPAVDTTPEPTTDQPEAAPQADDVKPLSMQSEIEQETTEQAPETVSGGDAPLMEPTPEMHRAAQEMHLVPPEVHSVAATEAEQPIRAVEQTTKPEQEMDDSPTNPEPEAPRRRTKSKSKFSSDPLRTSDLLTNKRKTSASLLTTRKSKVRNQPEPAIQATPAAPAAPVDPVRTKVPSALIRDLDATSYRRKNLSTRRLKSSQNRRSSFTYSPRWRQLQQELQEEQQESYPSNNYNTRHVSSGRRQYEDWFIEPQTPTHYQSSSRSGRNRGQQLHRRQRPGSRDQ